MAVVDAFALVIASVADEVFESFRFLPTFIGKVEQKRLMLGTFFGVLFEIAGAKTVQKDSHCIGLSCV